MSKLIIDEHPLFVLPSLAKEIGVYESIVLQQIHYWLDPKINTNIKEQKHWVYNSYEQWQEQFSFFSLSTIKRTIYSLEKLGLIIVNNFNKDKFNKTKWYTIDYAKVEDLKLKNNRSSQFEMIDQTNLTRSYKGTKTTITKTTRKNSLSLSLLSRYP
jgi:hypothetical protein